MKYFILFFPIMLLLSMSSQAQKVYRVNYESQAGWKNAEKQHLLL